jgi:HD superfamily phosphohydrolase
VTNKPNKRKIINDPVYGFININNDLVFDLIEHPWFQRLRRIRQLGLTYLVYPGSTHTRFQHALGAAFLMGQAINVIRSKGHEITEAEAEAVTIAILLHDVGHGPFSHALEYSLIEDHTHENLSELIMDELNKLFKGRLTLAIDIFKNRYQKKFLHQLVSGQLDMDRLDYLKRDSFFTGVTEGSVGSDRIIKMLSVANDNLVLEAKGIYSIEQFLIARRLMYWQVYLHKTVLSAETLLVNSLKRAKKMALEGQELFATPALHFFLTRKFLKGDLSPSNPELRAQILKNFVMLDDTDIIASTKVWEMHSDKVLSLLCKNMNDRILYKIEMQNSAFSKERMDELKNKCKTKLGLTANEVDYFVFSDTIINHTYVPSDNRISILFKNGTIADISEASDILDISVLSKVVKKYFLCYPREIK